MPLELFVALALAATLISVWGWGTTAGRLLGTHNSSVGPLWIGLATLSLLSVCLHLFVALSDMVALLLLFMGLAFALTESVIARRAPAGIWPLKSVLLSVVALGVVAVFAASGYQVYDTGLYHLQTVFWNQAYPVVPGLANLHGRFGFNNSVLSFGALFQSLPGGSTHYGSAVWVSAALIESMRALERMSEAYRARTQARFGDIGWVLLVIPAALITQERQYPGLSTDIPPFFASFPLLFVVLRGIHREPLSMADFSASLILATLLVTQKLSYAVFALTSVALVAILVVRSTPRFIHYARKLVPSLVFCALAGGAWILHGVVLSGYPFYPQSIFSVDVDWRVPKPMVDNEAAWVYSWARLPDASLEETAHFENWFRPWVAAVLLNRHVIAPIMIALSALIVLRLRRTSTGLSLSLLLLVVLFGFGLLYWYVTAPDVRFGLILFWGVAFSAVILFIQDADFRLALAILGLSLLIVGRTPVVSASTDVEVRQFVTDSGLIVNVPIEGDRCYGSAIPCTPYPNLALGLRGGTLGEGFRVLMQSAYP